MVCNHCGSQSHQTNKIFNHRDCPNYCTLCKEPGHRQKRAGCKFRVCNKCGISGHSATACTQTGCSECGSTTHKSAKSFACPEHKCTNCKGMLEPKGHNRNDCPRMHGCRECGSTTHKSALSFACPEQVHQLQRHARTKGPQPKRLPSNGNHDMRRMRRNWPQREQMFDRYVRRMR